MRWCVGGRIGPRSLDPNHIMHARLVTGLVRCCPLIVASLAAPIAHAGVIASTNFTDGTAANSFPAVTWTPTFSSTNVPGGNPNNTVYIASNGTVEVGTNAAFLGTYVDQTVNDSTTVTDYTWRFVEAAKGPIGPGGIPLVANPPLRYFHVAYGTSAAGANFTLTPTLSTTFVGSAITVSETPPSSPAGYTWTAWSGLNGEGTAPGLVNRGGTYFHIAYGTSSAGAGFTQTPTDATTWVGTYVDNTALIRTIPRSIRDVFGRRFPPPRAYPATRRVVRLIISTSSTLRTAASPSPATAARRPPHCPVRREP